MSVLLGVVLFLLASCNFCCSQECDSNGVKCVSCSKYQKCSGEITGCQNGETCTDSILEECKTKLNCYAGGECVGQGIFPDPLVEANFYVCLGDPFAGFSKYEFSCQPGQYFDASSNTCIASEVTDPTATISVMTTTSMEPGSSELTPSTASSVVTTSETTTTITPLTTTTPLETTSSPLTTTTPLETTSSPLTTTTTSLATTSSPLTTITTSSPLTTTTTPTTPSVITTSGTSPTTSPTASPVACIMPGIFPVLTNCKLYYRCSTSLQLFYFTCPGNSYFNEMILKCSLIISPSCQEQILKNSTSATPASTTTPITFTTTTTQLTTTTPAPTTSSAVTQMTTTPPIPTTSSVVTEITTITPIPTTSSAVTQTTTPAPTTPPITFVCPSVGTYENPISCKTYFRCSSSGDIFIFTCPGASYFNEITKKCTLVLTPRCVNMIQL